MKKIILLIMLVLFIGCSSESEQVQTNVGVLRGPSGMGMSYLMDKDDTNYIFTLAGAPEEITAGIISGSLDIAMVPTNLASTLYNVTNGEVNIIAVSTLGVLFVLDATGEIHEIEDLRGRTINISGQGAIPQFAFEHVLQSNGLIPGVDVNIIFNAEHTELAALMVAGNVEIGLLPQPFVTTVTNQNENIRIALDLTEEWESANPGSSMVQTAIIVRTEFLENHRDIVIQFLSDSAESVHFVNNNISEAAEIIGRLDIVPSQIAAQAIPRTNLVHITGGEMRRLVEGFLQVLYDANAMSVGGTLPSENFFFE